ncbi:MAG: glycosyltransferase family 2 protein [Paracoccaceae bacterium]
MLTQMLSVIIPACNEEAYIANCLTALFASTTKAEAIVIANGCHDATAARAIAMTPEAQAKGWTLTVLNLAQGGKPSALNAGDAAASHTTRVYLDADVIVSPPLMTQLAEALAPHRPLYATGTPHIPTPKTPVTRAYARFWQKLPFATSNAPGYGLFATNAMGRARWSTFPAIISDDTYIRLLFTPEERLQVPAPYDWPMIEGFQALTRVRRRQDAGVAELAELYPTLMANEAKPRLTPARLGVLAVSDPIGFATYASVSMATRLRRTQGWTRGR